MQTLCDETTTGPRYQYLVAFSLPGGLRGVTRRHVTVLADSQARAKRVCRREYPGCILVDVMSCADGMPTLASA